MKKRIIKQSNFQKNSFIFLETIISLIIVSVIVSIFSKLTYDKEQNSKFNEIIKISNQLKKSQYSNTSLSTKTLNVTKNSITSTILIDEITYENDKIKLKKYELKQ